jgi:2-polyprenyl-6-methoxyphenol hydroxylase-like FAD-dependent oxidoreductase
MSQPTTVKGRSAVVLGGGIAGLSSAGVLARHFEQVTVVERDEMPPSPEVRPHAPQGAHVHALLAGGLRSLTRLVPELPAWLDEMGFPEADLTQHVCFSYDGRWLPRVRSGIAMRTCTRPTIEHLLARDAARRPNVRVLDGTKVLRLVGDGRVTGVKVERGGAEEELASDLVVDASGRGSPSPKWLASVGVPPPEELLLDAGVMYTSCWFELTRPPVDDWQAMATSIVVPHTPRMGVAIRIGPERMLCAVIDYGRGKPPKGADEFVACMADLPVPELHRLLHGAARPVSDTSFFGNTYNRWRRYGKLSWFPEGIVVIGDAACSLNPRYGQGMTVAALGAEKLDSELTAHFAEHGHLRGFSHRFQKGLEKVLAVPWQMALMEDRLWLHTNTGGPMGLADRLVATASDRMLRTLFSDVDTYIRFMRVAQLLDQPTALLSPAFLAGLLRGGRRDGAPVPGPGVPA